MTASTTDRPSAGTWTGAAAADDRACSAAAQQRVNERRMRRMVRRAAYTHHAPASARPLSWWRELLFVAVVYSGYEFTRGLHRGGLSSALANGRAILHWEQLEHLAPEHALNQALTHATVLAVLAAYFYSTMHYLVTPTVLIWMYRKHPDHYRRARTTIALATVTGLIGFYLVPTAPPRLLAASGLRDTLEDVSDWGWWKGDGSVPRGLGGLTNQFAAMPSLHVGWALWCGVLVAVFARRTWVRVLGALYPVATSVVVMATGNHYLLDVFAGAVVMGWGFVAAIALEQVRGRLGLGRLTGRGRPAIGRPEPAAQLGMSANRL